jgi:hypothetical protein
MVPTCGDPASGAITAPALPRFIESPPKISAKSASGLDEVRIAAGLVVRLRLASELVDVLVPGAGSSKSRRFSAFRPAATVWRARSTSSSRLPGRKARGRNAKAG